VLTFTVRGVFIGVNETSTDLEKSVWRQVEAGWPSHAVGRLGGAASTDSAFSSSCRRMVTKARVEPSQTLVDWPAPGPTRPGVWPTWSTCPIHHHGDDDFDIWSTVLCHPLKYSNLVPKFLESNKH
jgi:hypothetical protein